MERATSMPASDQLEPFFFGPHDRRLYGCYHEPSTWLTREQAVLLCYSFSQEYIRAHRACQHLASRLAAGGFPTMRFDYFGTGNSMGASDEATLEDWLQDIACAADELRDRSGSESVVYAGLRLGASLALSTAGRRSDVAGLVLWEPIIDGRRYVDALKAQHIATIAHFFVAPQDHQPGAQPAELLGFALNEQMLTGLEQLDFRLPSLPRQLPIVVIDNNSEDRHEPALANWAESLRGTARVDFRRVPSFAAWVDDVDKGLVPHAVIEAIIGWMHEAFG